MLLVILLVLLAFFIIGKFIAANSADNRKTNLERFGNNMANTSKSLGCIIIVVVILVLLGGFLLIMNSIFGGTTLP